MEFLRSNWAVLTLVIALSVFLGASLATRDCPLCALSAAAKNTVAQPKPQSTGFSLSGKPWAVQTFRGEEIRSEDLKGKVVVIAFLAAWSPESAKDIAKLNELSHSIPASEAAIVGICIDHEATDFDAVFKERNVNIEVAVPSPSLLAAVGSPRYLPSLVLLGPDGSPKIRHVGLVESEILRAQILSIAADRELVAESADHF